MMRSLSKRLKGVDDRSKREISVDNEVKICNCCDEDILVDFPTVRSELDGGSEASLESRTAARPTEGFGIAGLDTSISELGLLPSLEEELRRSKWVQELAEDGFEKPSNSSVVDDDSFEKSTVWVGFVQGGPIVLLDADGKKFKKKASKWVEAGGESFEKSSASGFSDESFQYTLNRTEEAAVEEVERPSNCIGDKPSKKPSTWVDEAGDKFEKPSNWVGDYSSRKAYEKPSNWVGDESSSDGEAYEKPSNWVGGKTDSDSEDDDAYRERMMGIARKRNSLIEPIQPEDPDRAQYAYELASPDSDIPVIEPTQPEDPDRARYGYGDTSPERPVLVRQTSRRLSMPMTFGSAPVDQGTKENPYVGLFFSPDSKEKPSTLSRLTAVEEGKPEETRIPRRRSSVSHGFKPAAMPEPPAAPPSVERRRLNRRASTGGPSNVFTTSKPTSTATTKKENDPFSGGFDSAKKSRPGLSRVQSMRRLSMMQTTYDFEKMEEGTNAKRKPPTRRRSTMNLCKPSKEYEDGLKAFGAKSHQINQIYR